MVDCWSEIRKLKGRTLYTLAQKKPFDVLDVSIADVLILPHKNRIERSIPRQEIEDSRKALIASGQITARQIQDEYALFNSAFVSAMLAELPGIGYTLNPITLYTTAAEKPKPVLSTERASPPFKPPEPPQAPPELPADEPPHARFRDRASFGKRMEFVAIAELLRRGYDVYLPLVDDQGIDCILRLEKDGAPCYLDIQIKARSTDIKPAYAAFFAAMDISHPRPNFFFIFYSEQVDTFWVVPSLDLVKMAIQNKAGKNKGRYSINFCRRQAGRPTPEPHFAKYQDAFQLLDC